MLEIITTIAAVVKFYNRSRFSVSVFLTRAVFTAKSLRNSSLPPPSIAAVLIAIAKLGGYLARKMDGPPGTLVLWRGWKRLMDISEGWSMALKL